jgi:uncharacterized protein
MDTEISASHALAPPGRACSRPALLLALGSLSVLAAQAVAGPRAPPWVHLALAAAAVAIAAVPNRARGVRVLAAGLACAVAAGVPWQLAMATAIAVHAVYARVAGEPSFLGRVLRERGRVPIAATAVVAGVTPFALTGWLLVFRPNLEDLLTSIPRLPLPLLVLGGVAFALSNAALEELVWRGVFQEGFAELGGPAAGVLVSAASFGLAHAHGFPRGAVGVALAGTWAVMLGVLRHRARGLLAPLIAHVVADATIAVLLLAMLRG